MTLKDPHSAETINAIVKTGKPVIYSNGYHSVTPTEPEWKLLYCIPKYPADPKDIKSLLLEWDYDGFSDHCLGIEQALKYCKLRPDAILEKHVMLEGCKSPDSVCSITTQELAHLITRSTS